MKTTGIIVARFQTPYLHEGHRYLLDEIRSRHNKVVIVLGVSPVRGSRRNPFDFFTRERMLKQYAPELLVLPLADHPSDLVWSQRLDNLLITTLTHDPVVLYGSRDCFIPYYHGHLSVEALPEFGDYSATNIRNENADRVLDTKDFRMGINYAYQNTYTKVYPTVDIALFDETGKSVLLGRKPEAEEWRFPGGFADATDENYEAAAARELQEECGVTDLTPMEYVGSAKIDDWRYRSEDDKIITLLFRTTLRSGMPVPGDDLANVEWFALEKLEKMMAEGQLFPGHHVLAELLIKAGRSMQ